MTLFYNNGQYDIVTVDKIRSKGKKYRQIGCFTKL